MNVRFFSLPMGFGLASLIAACSSSSTPAASNATVTGYSIVAASGSMSAAAGDALPLKVVQTMSDGTTAPLPSTATVTWTSPTSVASLSPDSTADSPLPAAGAAPTGAFVVNAMRTDRHGDLSGVLFLLDPGTSGDGTLAVAAALSGSVTGTATGSVTVSAAPAGNATSGKAIFVANCASCHGTTGHGSVASTGDDGGAATFTIDGTGYSYPAPGLNAEPGNCGSDPDWNPALFAFAARTDVDNGGLALRVPMPDWLSEKSSTGAALTTQNLIDVFAYMKTQSQ